MKSGEHAPAIQLTHLGEILVTEMFQRHAAVRTFLGERARRNLQAMHAVREAPLDRYGTLSFDGASRIDIALVDEESRSCVACESKLGTDGLSARSFERRFLKQCRTSHRGTRVAGGVPAILERRLPAAGEGAVLKARVGDREYTVDEHWFLIVRRKTADGWTKRGRPELSERCTVVAFEDLVAAHGGRAAFNALVREILELDYFESWLG